MTAEPKVGEFLIRLHEEPALLEAYFRNPRAVVAVESGLSKEQQAMVLSQDPAGIQTALQREYPDLNFASQAWRPIKLPWPIKIPRPIKR
jgi:hypothetical protein